MPDITMCKGDVAGRICPLRESCYRFKAKSHNIFQSYFGESPYKDGTCDYYWETKADGTGNRG